MRHQAAGRLDQGERQASDQLMFNLGREGGKEGKGLAVVLSTGRWNARFDGTITDEISFPGRL